MTLLNVILAVIAAILWGGTVIWYFRNEIRHYRERRFDKWFRGD